MTIKILLIRKLINKCMYTYILAALPYHGIYVQDYDEATNFVISLYDCSCILKFLSIIKQKNGSRIRNFCQNQTNKKKP